MNEKHTIGQKFTIALFYFVVITFCLALPYVFEKKKGLTIYTYADLIPHEVFYDFEKKTGIPVYVKFFSSNEEMFAKLKIDKGSLYDLITPTDYMVEILSQEGLLQKIETKKITHVRDIEKKLMHRYFDPGNQYSVPLVWIIYGLGYSKAIFGEYLEENSWKMVFDVPKNKKNRPSYYISMLDDGREAFFFASLYAYKKVEGLTEKEKSAVIDILTRQWEWTENYTNANQAFYLQSGLVPITVVCSNVMFKTLEDSSDKYGFTVPNEGSIMAIENIVIPKTCRNVEAAHQLINHLLSEDALMKVVLKYGYYPANVHVLEDLRKNYSFSLPVLTDEEMDMMHILDNSISIETYSHLWLRVKSGFLKK